LKKASIGKFVIVMRMRRWVGVIFASMNPRLKRLQAACEEKVMSLHMSG
jgi:hypothetical protein